MYEDNFEQCEMDNDIYDSLRFNQSSVPEVQSMLECFLRDQ